MSKRLQKAVAEILSDPQNAGRSAEEVADVVIDAVREQDARTHRIAVVGQIQLPGRGPQTVCLGPFSSRGVIDTPEKFARTTEGGTAARRTGQGLAWDTRTGRGRGRFMLAPAFWRPRDAWEYHAQSPATQEAIAEVTEAVSELRYAIEPACLCGLKPPRHCYRHQK